MKRFEKRDGWFSKDKLEVIDNLAIAVKDGVYSGRLERLDIKGIRVDKEVYETHYKDSNVDKLPISAHLNIESQELCAEEYI